MVGRVVERGWTMVERGRSVMKTRIGSSWLAGRVSIPNESQNYSNPWTGVLVFEANFCK